MKSPAHPFPAQSPYFGMNECVAPLPICHLTIDHDAAGRRVGWVTTVICDAPTRHVTSRHNNPLLDVVPMCKRHGSIFWFGKMRDIGWHGNVATQTLHVMLQPSLAKSLSHLQLDMIPPFDWPICWTAYLLRSETFFVPSLLKIACEWQITRLKFSNWTHVSLQGRCCRRCDGKWRCDEGGEWWR